MANDIEKKSNALDKVVDWMIESGQQDIEVYVDKLRSQNTSLSCDELAKKIVRRKSHKNGLVGAITGVGGVITLPATIPADLFGSWKIQIGMALAIARVYGHDSQSVDMKTDIYLILAGDSAKEALKRAGIEISKSVTKKAVDRYITRDVMKKIWRVVSQKVITKGGEKSMLSFTRMVPLVGAPVGYAFDWAAARTVGGHAITYYSGGG